VEMLHAVRVLLASVFPFFLGDYLLEAFVVLIAQLRIPLVLPLRFFLDMLLLLRGMLSLLVLLLIVHHPIVSECHVYGKS